MGEISFDQLAAEYDKTFTNTALGLLQRKVVWNHLEKLLAKKNHPINVLELNCGTGEDAIFLSKKGHHVIATDLSKEMLRIAEGKVDTANVSNIEFKQLDLRSVEHYKASRKFDLVFSNFGGFNCLNESEMKQTGRALAKLISDDGILMLVIMPDQCLIEKIYALFKRDWLLYSRRSQSPQAIKLGLEKIWTWYYSPANLKRILVQYEVNYKAPVGFIPSYFNPKVNKWPIAFHALKMLNSLALKSSLLTRYADHFLISFSLKRK